VINVRIRTVSQRQNDATVSPAALQLVRSDKSRPQRGGLGSPNHIKESIKIKLRAQGCHITSRDVTFNVEILLHGRNIIRTQFEQDQPPEYALTFSSFKSCRKKSIFSFEAERLTNIFLYFSKFTADSFDTHAPK
jgi:hypothetical protein